MFADNVDTNLFDFYEFAASAAGKVCVEAEGYEYVDLGTSPWPRAVFALNFPVSGLPASLTEGITAGRIPNKVRVGPTSRPRGLEAALEAARFAPGKISRGMRLEIARRGTAAPSAALEVRRLSSVEDFEAFARIVSRNLFEVREDELNEDSYAYAGLLGLLDGDRAFGFLCLEGGKPASTAYAFVDSSGIGGIYFVATEADGRGRGCASAAVSAALEELARMGVEECILHATEPGLPVYKRLGFSELCLLPIYSLPTGT
jgi:GNAT superfamily N-acetyltransferase